MTFNPIIKELVFNDRIVRVDDICKFIKRCGGDIESFLLFIVNSYGYKSLEFIFVIQGLIFNLLNKYISITDHEADDLVMEIICSVMEKMEKFDNNKGKLTSFIHTIIRGEITKYKSKKISSSKVFDLNVFDDSVCDISDDNYDIDNNLFIGLDTVYKRLELWDAMKNG